MNTTPFKPGEYDNSIRKALPYYETINQEVADLVQIIKPTCKTWLDTGCGTGYLIGKVAKVFTESVFYLCDPAKDMLNFAKKRLKHIPKSRLFYIQCPSSELPSDLPRIEVITAILSHHYCTREERINATEKCYNLLRKGGIYLTVENIKPRTKKSTNIALKKWARQLLNQGKNKTAVKKYIKRFDKKYFPITLDEHIQLLKNTGFKTYDLFWLSDLQAGFYAIK